MTVAKYLKFLLIPTQERNLVHGMDQNKFAKFWAHPSRQYIFCPKHGWLTDARSFMYLLGILCCGHSLKIVKLPDVFATRPSLNHSTQLGLEAGKIFFFESWLKSCKKVSSSQKIIQKLFQKICPKALSKNLPQILSNKQS